MSRRSIGFIQSHTAPNGYRQIDILIPFTDRRTSLTFSWSKGKAHSLMVEWWSGFHSFPLYSSR